MHAISRRSGFTLIELLVVVAIIAILAAIAIPNMLEAQVRAKVSRTRADLRTIATAIEAYTVDNNRPPYDGEPGGDHVGWATAEAGLTTPIAYMTSVLADVFQDTDMRAMPPAPNTSFFLNPPANTRHAYDYGSAYWHNVGVDMSATPRWYGTFGQSMWKVGSCGPDLKFVVSSSEYFGFSSRYDPTNGTVSEGDIYRSQGLTQ